MPNSIQECQALAKNTEVSVRHFGWDLGLFSLFFNNPGSKVVAWDWVYDLSPNASLPTTSLRNQVRQPCKLA